MFKPLFYAATCLLLSLSQVNGMEKISLIHQTVDSVTLPAREDFLQSTRMLSIHTKQLRDKPDIEHVTSVREAWGAAKSAWERNAAVLMGPNWNLQSSIDSWPGRARIWRKILRPQQTPVDEAYIDEQGSLAKGLPALEWLLFNIDNIDEIIGDSEAAKRRRNYIHFAAVNLVNSAEKSLKIPQAEPEAERLRWLSSVDFGTPATHTSAQTALDALVNHQIQLLAMMLKTQIGKPLGHHQNGTVRPNMVESVYSKRGLMDIIDNLHSIRAVLRGGWEQGSTGGI